MPRPPRPWPDAEDLRLSLATRLLDVMEGDVLPLTRAGVARGDKVFGAAVLRKADLSLVVAETNAETLSPLWHGEVHALKRLHEGPHRGEDPTGFLLLSSHEPCTMCLSAIAWSGIDTIHYLFSHEESRDAFAIPHDLAILHEVFGLPPGGYRRRNAFWTATPIADLVAADPGGAALRVRMAGLRDAYGALSDTYQAGKSASGIPLA